MKGRFVKTYRWLFGTTRKEAERVYKTAPRSYISAIIESFETNAIRALLND